MRKKLIAVLMAGSMVASMAACGNSNTKTTTAAPTTAAPTTAAPTTPEAATTAAPTSEEVTTEAKTEAATEEATTEAKTEAATEEVTTEAATEEATTEAKTEAATEEVTTEAATEEATTEAKTEAATEEVTTEAATEEATTEKASAAEVSTEEATTEAKTEEATIEAPTTEEATTEAPTTEEATTEAPTTEEATTEAPTTEEATTEAPTTEEATTEAPTTEEATTEAPTTEEATTEAPTTEEATTEAPATEEDTTEAKTEEATTEAKTEDETEEATTEENIDGTGVKIGIVTDVGGVNDGSFNQSAWEGLQRAGEKFGCEVKYLESKGDADYAPNIEAFVDEEYDLIICVGYMLAGALKEAAEMYPDQKFAIIDDATNSDLENVTCLMFEQAQASYLVGLAAGYTTKTNVVGFVLGMESAVMNEFGYGYCAGVLDANPDAKILQYNANAFGDVAGGKNAATKMVADKADVIFHAAGGTGLGVIDGCKENDIWAIGVDSDQSIVAPETVLTSAMKRVDNACYDTAKATILGTLEAGVKFYDLSVGGVDLAPTTDNLDEEVLAKIEEAKEAIIAGDIVVPKTKEEFEEKYGDVYELDSEE